jgi:hypothetical protein
MAIRATSIGIVVLGLVAAAPADAQGCLSRPTMRTTRSVSQSTHVDDDRKSLSVRWRRGDCEMRLEARGEFGVRADLAGFTFVEDGASVLISEQDGDIDRSVRVTGDGKTLQYRWRVDGHDGFDVDKEKWVASYLTALERRTAMFVKTRVPELLRQGGPTAVLDETERLESDYPRRVYLTTLLASTTLTEPMIERMLGQVGENMSSDYERAELLLAVAKQGAMGDRVAQAVIKVARTMSSDYEKRRALSAALNSVSSLPARTALFTVASTMSSSYELAELLIAAQVRSMVDSGSASAYFRAVDRITSDYEHRRTLSALLKQRPSSTDVLAGVLKSSAAINSDYELATLLVEFAREVPVRGTMRELYLQAARAIGSDHEYRRVLQALLDQDKRT